MRNSIFLIIFLFLSYTGSAQKLISINNAININYKEITKVKGQVPYFDEAKRFRELSINQSLQSDKLVQVNDTILLGLFADKQYKAFVDKVETDINGTILVRARLIDFNFSYCFISTYKGKSVITIDIPENSENYMSKYDGNTNTYYLLDLDKSKMNALEGGPSLIPPTEEGNNSKNTIKPSKKKEDFLNGSSIKDATTPDVVTVLIVYTPAAEAWSTTNETSINNTINLLMAKANLALSNSNTLTQLKLVHSESVTYTELDNSTDLSNLTGTSDGYMDNIHTLRNTYYADLVVLVEKCEFTGGLGWLLNTTSGLPSYAFSLTRVQQASWTYTTIHEIGHNMGCHHHKDQNTQPGPGLFTYSSGSRWTGLSNAQYCSIMTYEAGTYFADGINHTRLPFFSNPSIQYEGIAVGDATNADNAYTIRQVKSTIAGYRTGGTTYYAVSCISTPTEGGTTSGEGAYASGESCTVTATPKSGYTFTNWTKNGSQVSTSASYTFTASANTTLVANFSLQSFCSGQTTLTTPTGSFTDGSGASNYGHYADCKWLIQPAGATSITLSFSSFYTEGTYDYVKVYDGSTTSATLLGTFSGLTIPASVTSSGGVMLVNFVTNGAVNYSGWSASYTSTGIGTTGCVGGTQYPTSALTPTSSGLTQSGIYAGTYSLFNVTSGKIYSWSLCSADGGDASYDSQLTLLKHSDGSYIAYSDNGCGDDGKIDWTATFTGQVRVLVTKNNCLPNTTSTKLAYECVLPSSAGTITGTTTVCQGQTSVTYTVPSITNASTYTWTLPSGATGSSTTNSITVNYGSSAVSGNVTVKGNNLCGSGSASTLAITVNPKPSTPVISISWNTLHSDASSGNQWYNLSGLISGAVSQNYNPPTNGTYYDIVTLSGCSSSQSNSINFILNGSEIVDNISPFKIYPNPVSNELIIEFKGNTKGINFEILSSNGQSVYKGTLVEKSTVQTGHFTPGVYILRFENGNSFEFKRIVKE